MDKKLQLIILVIVILIPSFVAMGYYSATKREPVDSTSVTSLRLEDPNGKSWSFSSDDENADAAAMVQMFIDMRKNASPVEALPAAVESDGFFKVTLTSFDIDTVYEYYFTQDPEAAYLKDTAGMAYKVASADATKFLTLEYSACLYDSELPMLKVGEGTEISPAAAIWNYKSYNAEYVPLDTAPYITNKTATCTVDGGFSFSFSVAPDRVTVVIDDGTNEIYNGLAEDMSANLDLGGATEFNVSMSAEWYESADKTYYGSATYKFRGEVAAQPVFYLGQTTVENGKFVCVAGKNVADPSQIRFSSDPSIDYEPTFFKEGGYVYTLIPIRYELENGKDQNYTFTLTYGGYSQQMNLTVESYKYGNSSSGITKSVENATYTEEYRNEAETVLRELAKKEELDVHAFTGTFLEDVVGAGSTDKISPGFGRNITVTATGTTFRHTGVDYNVKQGTDVLAVNNGRVVYSGYLATTGYIVVVDHGWGLKSWYCHLSECSVNVGDDVEKGQTVGKSGDTGFAAKNRTHVGLTVYDVPVCIYGYWNNPVQIPSMD